MLPPSRTLRLAGILLAALAIVSAPRLLAQTAAGDPVVELPTFNVTDTQFLPEPEKWRHGQIPGFEVLTNASDRATKRLLKEFQQFQQALSLVWPGVGRGAPNATMIICGRKGKFDEFEPFQKSGPDVARASLFLKNREQTSIIIDLEASVVNVSSADVDTPESGTDSSQISVDHSKQLSREYVRYLLSQSEPRLPVWFEEGMAQIVMAMKYDRKLIEFGKIEDPNTISAAAGAVARMNASNAADGDGAATLPGAPAEDSDFNRALSRRALIPMQTFFDVTRDAPESANPLGNNRWAKQAYAFVHMCLYGRGQKYTKPFATFLMRSTREPITEAMFKDCFKMSYRDMLFELRGYVETTDYKSQEFRIKGDGLPLPAELVLRDATQPEVGRIKGAALFAAGRADKARAELIAPYLRGERDPELLAELGVYEVSVDHKDRARKFLEAAVAGKTARPRAYYELARIRFEDVMPTPNSPIKIEAASVKGIVTPLLEGKSHSPAMPEIYELLANTWVHSAVPPSRDELIVLVQGAQLFQQRLGLIYQTAVLCAAAGVNDAATSLVDYGIKVSNPAARERFEALKATLPPAPPATAAKAAASTPP